MSQVRMRGAGWVGGALAWVCGRDRNFPIHAAHAWGHHPLPSGPMHGMVHGPRALHVLPPPPPMHDGLSPFLMLSAEASPPPMHPHPMPVNGINSGRVRQTTVNGEGTLGANLSMQCGEEATLSAPCAQYAQPNASYCGPYARHNPSHAMPFGFRPRLLFL